MCLPSAASLLAVCLLAVLFVSPGAAAASPRSAVSLSVANFSENATGPERCLESDAPVWCLAEEVGSGIARALYPEGLTFTSGATGKGTLTDSFDFWSGVAARSFDLDFSSPSETEEESRSKRRRKFAFFFMAIASVLAVIIPLKLKAIAVIAMTALFVGKLALIIASLVGLKKVVSSKQSDETTHVHYSGHRSDPDAHFLAYGEHVPQYAAEERY